MPGARASIPRLFNLTVEELKVLTDIRIAVGRQYRDTSIEWAVGRTIDTLEDIDTHQTLEALLDDNVTRKPMRLRQADNLRLGRLAETWEEHISELQRLMAVYHMLVLVPAEGDLALATGEGRGGYPSRLAFQEGKNHVLYLPNAMVSP